MANKKELDHVIQIDGEEYSITAEKAKEAEKVVNSLTIKNSDFEFNGSEPKTLELKTINNQSLIGEGNISITGGDGGDADFAEKANKIQVNMGDGSKPYATITISADEPSTGSVGDIWFKY